MNALTMDGHHWLADGFYELTSSLLVRDGMEVVVLAGLSMFGNNGVGVATDPLMMDFAGGGTFTSQSGVFLTAVPEPATLLLMGGGLAAGAMRRLLQRRRAES